MVPPADLTPRRVERWPADNVDRVRSDAAELVELKPDAILVEAE